MGKIYKGQTSLSINVNLGVDITGGTPKLKYKKPDNTTGEFTSCTIISATTGDIKYTVVDSNDFDVVGKWVLWGYVTFVDSTVAAGEPFELIIYKEGT